MIPTDIRIDPRVLPRLTQWMENQLKADPSTEEEEDCCGSSSFTFHGCSSGIGDSWWVTRGKKRLYFGVDDDNDVYFREETTT